MSLRSQEQVLQDQVLEKARYAASVALIALTLSPLLSGAVNCNSPQTPQERVVCTNSDLLELDRRLEAAFQKALAIDNKGFPATLQKSWKKEDGQCENDSGCLKALYGAYLSQLEPFISMQQNRQAKLGAVQLASEVEQMERQKDELKDQISYLVSPKAYFVNTSKKQYLSALEHNGGNNAALQQRAMTLRSEIAALQEQLNVRKKQITNEGQQTLVAMRQKATDFKSLSGPLANAPIELTKRCDQLAAAIDKSDAKEILKAMDAARTYSQAVEVDRTLYADYVAWESRRRIPAVGSTEASVQGITLTSTYTDVVKAIGSSCPEIKAAGLEENVHSAAMDCVVIGGRKRFTIFEFGPDDNEAQAQLQALQGKGTGEVYKWALNRLSAQRRLIHLEVSLGNYAEADFKDTLAALKGKYRLNSEPTPAEREKFNRFRIETRTFTSTGRPDREPVRYEFFPKFDATEIDYYFSDYRVWLATRHIGTDINISVHYVDSQIADQVKKGRETAKLKPSEF